MELPAAREPRLCSNACACSQLRNQVGRGEWIRSHIRAAFPSIISFPLLQQTGLHCTKAVLEAAAQTQTSQDLCHAECQLMAAFTSSFVSLHPGRSRSLQDWIKGLYFD